MRRRISRRQIRRIVGQALRLLDDGCDYLARGLLQGLFPLPSKEEFKRNERIRRARSDY